MTPELDKLLQLFESSPSVTREWLKKVEDEELMRLSEGIWLAWEREGPSTVRRQLALEKYFTAPDQQPPDSRRRYPPALNELIADEVQRRMNAAGGVGAILKRLREPNSWQKWVEHRQRTEAIALRIAQAELPPGVLDSILGTNATRGSADPDLDDTDSVDYRKT